MNVGIGVGLKEIVVEAYAAMPPIGNDSGAADNFAQRILTKKISELRKSGQMISDNKAQELRAALDVIISDFDMSDLQASFVSTEKITVATKQKPSLEILSTIVANNFHTSTDGSKARIALLTTRAMKEAVIYIENCDASWLECFRLKKRAKKMINEKIVEL